MAWVTRRGGGGASAGSGWRKDGERDPRPVGQLSRLAAHWVGPNRPVGRLGHLGQN
jgi:hypothetical protein